MRGYGELMSNVKYSAVVVMVTKALVVICVVTLLANLEFGRSRIPVERILKSLSKDLSDDHPEYGRIPLLNRKIVFSAQRSVAEHPYVANVLFSGSHHLTGVVLSRNVVLTTARRLLATPTELLTVVVGESFNDRGAPQHRVILKVIHSAFDKVKLRNNLALLRIFRSFEYRAEVKSLPLFDAHDSLAEGTHGFVTGWGRCDSLKSHICLPRELIMYRGELKNPGLMTAYVAVNDSNSRECIEGYAKIGVGVEKGQLCAGSARVYETLAPCLAATGAPLVVRGHLLGVLSWGWGCGHRTDLPLIYADLRYYTEWVTSNVHTLTDKVGRCASRTLLSASLARVFRLAAAPFSPTDDESKAVMLPLLPLFLDADVYV